MPCCKPPARDASGHRPHGPLPHDCPSHTIAGRGCSCARAWLPTGFASLTPVSPRNLAPAASASPRRACTSRFRFSTPCLHQSLSFLHAVLARAPLPGMTTIDPDDDVRVSDPFHANGRQLRPGRLTTRVIRGCHMTAVPALGSTAARHRAASAPARHLWRLAHEGTRGHAIGFTSGAQTAPTVRHMEEEAAKPHTSGGETATGIQGLHQGQPQSRGRGPGSAGARLWNDAHVGLTLPWDGSNPGDAPIAQFAEAAQS